MAQVPKSYMPIAYPATNAFSIIACVLLLWDLARLAFLTFVCGIRLRRLPLARFQFNLRSFIYTPKRGGITCVSAGYQPYSSLYGGGLRPSAHHLVARTLWVWAPTHCVHSARSGGLGVFPGRWSSGSRRNDGKGRVATRASASVPRELRVTQATLKPTEGSAAAWPGLPAQAQWLAEAR